jgi:hypothetical protein
LSPHPLKVQTSGFAPMGLTPNISGRLSSKVKNG